MTTVTDWNGYDENDNIWANFKAHFVEAYKLRLNSGPTANTVGYREAAAASATTTAWEALRVPLRKCK